MASKVTRHASSDRPTLVKVGQLPDSAYTYETRTPFQEVVYRLSKEPGAWFQLTRTYTSPASPVSSARKAADEILPPGASERLQFASEPVPNNRVIVYLRLLPEVFSAPPEDEDLSDRFDEDDSIFDQVEASPAG